MDRPCRKPRLVMDQGRQPGDHHCDLHGQVPAHRPLGPARMRHQQQRGGNAENEPGHHQMSQQAQPLLASRLEAPENPCPFQREDDSGQGGRPVLPIRHKAGPTDDGEETGRREKSEQRVKHQPACFQARGAVAWFIVFHAGRI